MGTDITGVLQVWWKGYGDKLGQWVSEYPMDTHRNGYLFAALADVRNGWDIESIDGPRGLPDDFRVSLWDESRASTRLIEGLLHSVSWLTLEELNTWSGWDQVVMVHEDEEGPPLPLRDHCTVFLAWLNYVTLATAGQQARVVFGFD